MHTGPLPSRDGSQTSRVVRGDRVKLLCQAKLDDGQWLDEESERNRPVWIKAGLQGASLKPIVDGVIGMIVGEQKSLTIPPAAAFGDPRADRVFEVSLSSLPRDSEVGDLVPVTGKAFKGDAVIHSIKGAVAVLDGNHPLAGRTMFVELQILEIEKP